MSTQVAKDYFEFLADLGMTKHYGSLEATHKLVEICRIDGPKFVLDVGSGMGATPCYLAKTLGCRVVGVDLVEKMIEQSRLMAQERGVEELVEFRVADARELPFEDDQFDAVISESVNIFFENKLDALREYKRVTKPGGYVGMTEMTWLVPPSPEIEGSFKSMVSAHPLDAPGWKELLVKAGLSDVAGDGYRMEVAEESRGRFERYGRWRLTKIMLKMPFLLLRDRRSRQFMKDGAGAMSRDMLDVIGYGVYAGRKS